LLGAFERVSSERVAVTPTVVLLCACLRAGAGMAQLIFFENLGGLALSFLIL
jgi:hypothetical protein